ncbi:hypothetical protein [Frondihabitans australicus]|nr:hypothetical protein [Frondihabitans australicus]
MTPPVADSAAVRLTEALDVVAEGNLTTEGDSRDELVARGRIVA